MQLSRHRGHESFASLYSNPIPDAKLLRTVLPRQKTGLSVGHLRRPRLSITSIGHHNGENSVHSVLLMYKTPLASR
jgi:hypothetical protein